MAPPQKNEAGCPGGSAPGIAPLLAPAVMYITAQSRGGPERQINAHKEQERRKKARGIHWSTELPDNPSGGFKSFVSNKGFL